MTFKSYDPLSTNIYLKYSLVIDVISFFDLLFTTTLLSHGLLSQLLFIKILHENLVSGRKHILILINQN